MSRFRKLRGALVNKLPLTLRKPLIYKYRLKVPFYRNLQLKTLNSIKSKGSANVMFVVSSLSMWKYDEVLNLLLKDSRFKVHVVLYPFSLYSPEEKQLSIERLERFFSDKGIEYINAYAAEVDIKELLNTINPDIIFYTQPYEGIYGNLLEYKHHLDKLIIYSPYGINIAQGDIFNNSPLHNLAWRIYQATPIHKKMAKRNAYNNGENVVVVGLSNSERFKDSSIQYPWKKNGEGTKKIIWAPHYSILEGHELHHASFLWLHDYMLHIADRYNGRLQVAFKPHPKLKTLMYEHPDWGKVKTDAYYQAWADGENTLLEEGNYVPLFAGSDAMIHDSCAFIGEYLYTEKPVLFSSRQPKEIRKECNSFGKSCLDLHYHADNEFDITRFIDEVVFGNQDILSERRHKFNSEVLSINDGHSTGKRIYKDIITFLGWGNDSHHNRHTQS